MKKRLFLVLSILALAGCGGGNDSVDLTGTWSGTSVNTVNRTAQETSTVKFVLQQIGTSVTGTLTSSNGNSGAVAGTVSGSTVAGKFTPSDVNTCPFNFTLAYTANKLTGIATAFNCTASASSALTLAR